MNSDRKNVLFGKNIYSRPQERVNTNYILWQQNHPNGSTREFLLDNCKMIYYEGKHITKWRCEDIYGSYIVKSIT